MRRLMEIVRHGRVDLRPLLTHHMTLDEIVAGYELFGQRRDGVLKIAVRPVTTHRPGWPGPAAQLGSATKAAAPTGGLARSVDRRLHPPVSCTNDSKCGGPSYRRQWVPALKFSNLRRSAHGWGA
jgi:hypothetical protein